MTIILFILLVLVILVVVLFTVALRVNVVFDTCKTGLNMTLLWLHSYLKALVTIDDAKPMLTLYLFNKKLFNKYLKRGKGKGKGKLSSTELVKIVDSRDVHVDAYYGFRDPFDTSIACGAINAAMQFKNLEYINHMPDFTTENDYIYLDANAKVNLGSTLLKFIKLKTTS